jgi:cyclase
MMPANTRDRTSGGMGISADLTRVVLEGMADAVAMADILHYKRSTVAELRGVAREAGFGVRDYAITTNFSN